MDRVGGQLAAVAIAGEQRLAADAATFNEWLQARRANDRVLQAMLVRRFSPEYHNPQLEQAEHLNEEAAATEFEVATCHGSSPPKGVRAGGFEPPRVATPGPKLRTRCAGRCSPGLYQAFKVDGRQSVVPSCTRSARGVVARPVSNLVSIGVPVPSGCGRLRRSGPPRPGTGSAGRARQG